MSAFEIFADNLDQLVSFYKERGPESSWDDYTIPIEEFRYEMWRESLQENGAHK